MNNLNRLIRTASFTVIDSNELIKVPTLNQNIAIIYDVITPYASYVALAFVFLMMFFIVVSKLVITVDTTKSDLILYNTTPQKLEILVSKQLTNSGAMHNIHAAVACGLMDPPPNYQPPKALPQPPHKMNGFVHQNSHPNATANSPVLLSPATLPITSNVEEPVKRKKNLKF